MTQSIATIALVVADYDEAIQFYCEKLGFSLVSDTDLGGGKRWVVVGPSGNGARLLLARPMARPSAPPSATRPADG